MPWVFLNSVPQCGREKGAPSCCSCDLCALCVWVFRSISHSLRSVPAYCWDASVLHGTGPGTVQPAGSGQCVENLSTLQRRVDLIVKVFASAGGPTSQGHKNGWCGKVTWDC